MAEQPAGDRILKEVMFDRQSSGEMSVVYVRYADELAAAASDFRLSNESPYLVLQTPAGKLDGLARVETFLFLEFRRGNAIIQVVKNRFCRRFEAPAGEGDRIVKRLEFEQDSQGNMQVSRIWYVGIDVPVTPTFTDLIESNMDLSTFDSMSGVDMFTILEFKRGGKKVQVPKPRFCRYYVP